MCARGIHRGRESNTRTRSPLTTRPEGEGGSQLSTLQRRRRSWKSPYHTGEKTNTRARFRQSLLCVALSFRSFSAAVFRRLGEHDSIGARYSAWFFPRLHTRKKNRKEEDTGGFIVTSWSDLPSVPWPALSFVFLLSSFPFEPPLSVSRSLRGTTTLCHVDSWHR